MCSTLLAVDFKQALPDFINGNTAPTSQKVRLTPLTCVQWRFLSTHILQYTHETGQGISWALEQCSQTQTWEVWLPWCRYWAALNQWSPELLERRLLVKQQRLLGVSSLLVGCHGRKLSEEEPIVAKMFRLTRGMTSCPCCRWSCHDCFVSMVETGLQAEVADQLHSL